MIMPEVQIYILSRDRPIYLSQTLLSALGQGGAEVLVSDNSETDSVERMLAERFPEVLVVRRKPTLPALQHFRVVVEESSAEFLVMFHDDDVLFPGYLEAMLRAMKSNPDLVAVGCNARVLQDEQETDELMMGGLADPIRINDAEAMARRYLSYECGRPAPFPGYMYRRRFLDGLFLNPAEGGKYSDVSFLMKLAQRGPIMWLPQPLIWYRRHGSNDTGALAIPQLLRLLGFIYQHTSIRRRSSLVQQYRFRYWLRWWRSGVQTGGGRRQVVGRFLLWQGLKFALSQPARCLKFIIGIR